MLDHERDLTSKAECGTFRLRIGKPIPFGASVVPGGVNFSVYSRFAIGCELVLFRKHEPSPFCIIPFKEEFRIGNVFTMIVCNLEYENLEYGFRMDGPFHPREGHRYDKAKILMDPYAKMISGRDVWGVQPACDDIYPYRARISFDDFDWGDDHPLEIPIEDLIIYEMHVRGFTRHPSSGVKHPGTFAGVKEKIPYLKELGVNCVELMPIHEFDEFENARSSFTAGFSLLNYWGYSSVGFFAPKAGYAAGGKAGMQVEECKSLIRELHKNGIEVILDVVFNHTAEGNERGPYISYRGIDNKTYYLLGDDGSYLNFSGCGNTLNCNNPIVRSMILDCLRYWVAEYHIDGFRFDLASILGRDQDGNPMSSPPLLETLAFDPVLGKCKLIAEAWDAGGLYQVGSFPAWGRWAEWNGQYRDDLRKFLKGDGGMAGSVALRLSGSPDLYGKEERGACASINFFIAHDGFTLNDLVSYNVKHNEGNGEDNRDGYDDNSSWNCGCEGGSDDPDILRLRLKQMKNAVAMLLISQGTPMILAGDEIGRTQMGNNNAYCQDNEISWIDWGFLKKNGELFDFFRKMIMFRRAHPVLRNKKHLRSKDVVGSGCADISWFSPELTEPDYSYESRALAFMLCGRHAKGGTIKDNSLYVAMNMHWQSRSFQVPVSSEGEEWHVVVNTDVPPPCDIWAPGDEKKLSNQSEILLGPRSVMVLLAKNPR
jgi:isoamylase